jgi:coenzyme F420-0:L-glutamate ligase/coenzyme F420-1:gamma-L-glutamate ligase
VSKAGGRVVRLADIEPSERAREIAGEDQDPRRIEAILREAKRVVRVRKPLVIAETRHGFICASAGVDASNAPEPGCSSASSRPRRVRTTRPRPRARADGSQRGVLVTDSFGRPWRQGTIDVALGAAGSR